MKKNSDSKFSRRNFIGTTATAVAGFSIIPSHAVAGLGHIPPSDKLNIAGVGVVNRSANLEASSLLTTVVNTVGKRIGIVSFVFLANAIVVGSNLAPVVREADTYPFIVRHAGIRLSHVVAPLEASRGSTNIRYVT